MLFDLRSRGRRRTVQAVYLGLAILIAGGLVLVGAGSGSGGGLLNGLGGGGSSGAQNGVVNQQLKAAEAQTRRDPSSAAAWGNLVNASWTTATGTAADYDSATSTFTPAGRRQLQTTVAAWQRYLSLTKTPDQTLATLAARAYAQLGDYQGAAGAWQVVINDSPNEVRGYECLAASAFAAKNDRVGQLALNKALALTPKSSRATLQSQVTAAKTDPAVAQGC